MPIETERHGIIHYHAWCEKCNFEAAIHTDETPTTQDVRNAVRRHVEKTKHSVSIEGGSSTLYTWCK